MVTRRLLVRAPDVAYLKGIVEAHDGLAQVFAEGGGDLTLAAPADRERELDELVRDLAAELGGVVLSSAEPEPRADAEGRGPESGGGGGA